MISAVQIEEMTREEKLQAMEILWAGLSADDLNTESPPWHEEALKETEERIAAGQEKATDWTMAKRELRKRFE